MRISFTGTRRGANEHQLELMESWLLDHRSRIAVAAHGCCVGADMQFHALVRKICGRSAFIAVFPSTAKTRAPIPDDADHVADPAPPLERNKVIVRTGHDQLLAVPRTMSREVRSGTWHAVRYAEKVGVPVEVLWPR